MSFLGIDLGTSGLRALLVDDEGHPIAAAEQPYTVSHPHPGWAEQDPADWIAALEHSVNTLRATHPEFTDLRGIGVAGHMHGAVTLDADLEVIRPCILWNDTRSALEAVQLDARQDVRALTGNIVFPGFTAPKLAWMRHHEPENFTRTAQVLLPASFLNLYLTGECVMDMSDAAGTSWLDTGARNWSDTLLINGQMRRDQMPRLVEGCAPSGQLRPELARNWGVSQSVTVAGGAGDNAAAACGIGALSEGQGFVSLGTSGVLLAARDGYHPSPDTALHTFCHAVPGRWYQMGVMLSATQSLNWLSQISGKSPAELTRALGEALRPPGPELFLPYLSGERTPHNDADIRGALMGVSTETQLADLTRAVLEGVAFALRDSAEAMQTAGADLNEIYAIGGGAASSYWLKLIATVLGVTLRRPRGGEFGAALGAARLGLIAATGVAPETVIRAPSTYETVPPDSSLSDAFSDAYRRFRAAYPALRGVQ